jgi:hypothetical protein
VPVYADDGRRGRSRKEKKPRNPLAVGARKVDEMLPML